MSENITWSHYNPVRVEWSPLETLAKHVSGQHVLLVTSPGFVKRGVAQRVKDILAPRLITVWDGVKPNPDLKDLDAASRALRPLKLGCVVGLGGGSALDAAKVLATTIPTPALPTLAQVFRDKAPTQWVPRLPLVAIPTTAGTGAEVTPFATIWDHEQHKKYSLSGDFMFPDVALLDASLTMTLDEEDTLYPALDAISHALESLWNKNCTPVSRAFAYQALALSNASLTEAIADPENYKHRRNLQNASVLAGMAISQTRTAIAHAMSYPLTVHFGVPHGLACSIMLPKLIEKNIKIIVNDKNEEKIVMNVREKLLQVNMLGRMSKYANKEQIQSRLIEMNESTRIGNYIGEGTTEDLMKQAIENEK